MKSKKPTLTLTFCSQECLEYFESVWLSKMEGTSKTKDGRWFIDKELDMFEDYLANKEAGF